MEQILEVKKHAEPRVCQLFQQGFSAEDISKTTGSSKAAIENILAKSGYDIENPPFAVPAHWLSQAHRYLAVNQTNIETRLANLLNNDIEPSSCHEYLLKLISDGARHLSSELFDCDKLIKLFEGDLKPANDQQKYLVYALRGFHQPETFIVGAQLAYVLGHIFNHGAANAEDYFHSKVEFLSACVEFENSGEWPDGRPSQEFIEPWDQCEFEDKFGNNWSPHHLEQQLEEYENDRIWERSAELEKDNSPLSIEMDKDWLDKMDDQTPPAYWGDDDWEN